MATYTQRKEPKRPQDHVHAAAVAASQKEADYDGWPECNECGEPFNPKREDLGYTTCLSCGEPQKQYTLVPVPKSNYTIATSMEQVLSPYSHKGNK